MAKTASGKAMQVMAPCTVNGLERAKKKNKEFVAIVTLKNCPPCAPTKAAVKAAVDKKVPILEIKAENMRCDPLLDKLHVTETPTVLYFKGSKMTRISEGTKTDAEIGDTLKALVAKVKA